MKINRLLVFLCVVAGMTAVARADLIGTGSWSKEAAGAYDRWVLTVTPAPGDIMSGFDIRIVNSLGNLNNNGNAFSSDGNKGVYTNFLLHQNHNDGDITDLVTNGPFVSSTSLKSNFGVTTNTGASYAAGFSSTLELAELVVPTGTITSPETQFTVTSQSYTSQPARYFLADSTPRNIVIGSAIPEPSTLSLVGRGLGRPALLRAPARSQSAFHFLM